MRNPLNKRLPKELVQDFGKYLVIFVFMAGLIAIVSGFLVAENSVITAYDESFEKYNIEDGNLELSKPMDSHFKSVLEDEDLTIYNNYYVEEPTANIDSTLRMFVNREEINKVCIMDGELPTSNSEIAIDRVYAQNNELSIGDTITVADNDLTITGLVALSDYSALFSNNSDMMFDSIKFGVAVVTQERFDSFGKANLHYCYSWKYDTPLEELDDDTTAESKSNDILKALYLDDEDNIDLIESFTPEYSNQAIHFAGDDMGGDKIMMVVFLYIVVAIIAFVFAITTNNTISKEASIIGTLRASGYSKREVLSHYITMPVIVTIVSAIVGNVVGYTALKDFCATLYYGSYSLVEYTTLWNAEAFVSTTVVPCLIMLFINYFILSKKLELSPLRFLKHDLESHKNNKNPLLPSSLDFLSRFRIRVILQNVPNYITMFVGIFFAEFILMFGFLFAPLLEKYEADICNSMFSTYQYMLKDTVETSNTQAEKFSANSLLVDKASIKDSVTIYGIVKNSQYIDLSLSANDVYVSSAYADKYAVNIGDIITLKNPYGNARYGFTVTGIYEYPSTLAVFMSTSKFNQIFNFDDDYFNGYFSNEEITDIDDKDIANLITVDDLTKVSRQLETSMGGMMSIYTVFGAVMFTLLIYLLSKLIIEKNSNSISMIKILGYSDIEIGRLYILATSLIVVLMILLAVPLCNGLMAMIFKTYMAKNMSGWLPYYTEPIMFIKMIVLGILCYSFVGITQLFKIKKIPMTNTLKNVE